MTVAKQHLECSKVFLFFYWDFESTRETVNPSWVSQLNQVHFITSLICLSKLVLAVVQLQPDGSR